jgi:Rod binding domain-containing protein
MQVPAIPSSAAEAASRARQATRGTQGAFEELARVNFQRSASASSQEQAARHAANQLVATAFVKPLLQQVHQSAFRSELFHGGAGERMFQDHLDTILAERITQRTGFAVAEQIYRHVARLPREVNSRLYGTTSPAQPAVLTTHG